MEVVEKLLLIAFGLILLFMILGWAVPELVEIDEKRKETGETEESQESTENQKKVDNIEFKVQKIKLFSKEISSGIKTNFTEKKLLKFYFRDLINEVF